MIINDEQHKGAKATKETKTYMGSKCKMIEKSTENNALVFAMSATPVGTPDIDVPFQFGVEVGSNVPPKGSVYVSLVHPQKRAAVAFIKKGVW